MEYRDSSQNSVHFLKGVVGGVDSSNGVAIFGTSTGGVVEAVSDDAATALLVRGKGTGALVLGNSSSPVQLNGTARVGSSGTAMVEARRFTVSFTAPELSSGLTSGAESTYTVTGVSSGTTLIFTPSNAVNALYTYRPRCSTVDELVIAWGNIGDSTLGSGESSNHGQLLQFRF